MKKKSNPDPPEYSKRPNLGTSEAGTMNRHVYHYCAHYQQAAGTLVYIDGIAQVKNRITSMEDLRDLKKAISPDNNGEITIISLSFMGMEYE